MSVRLSDDEAWDVIEASHTGILTTLRSDGSPIALPVWFVVLDRTVCIGAPRNTKKIIRLRNDPRASFLVESGARWDELRGVHLSGRAGVETEAVITTVIAQALEHKYRNHRSMQESLPASTQAHYGARSFLRLRPQGRILSWDNARMRLRDA